jgi:hypothetical protein
MFPHEAEYAVFIKHEVQLVQRVGQLLLGFLCPEGDVVRKQLFAHVPLGDYHELEVFKERLGETSLGLYVVLVRQIGDAQISQKTGNEVVDVVLRLWVFLAARYLAA